MPVSQTDKIVTISLPNGSSAEIYKYGATVTSWKAPAANTQTPVTERLFLSSKAYLDGSKPIRGGIPIAFPFFGPPSRDEDKKMGQHGYARAEEWELLRTVMDNEAGVSVKFGLHLPEEKRVQYGFDYDVRLEYIVTLAVHELATHLVVHNDSEKPLTHQALLHTYFACDASQVTVAPLKGLTYLDKTRNYAETLETRDEVDVRNYTDAVYRNAGADFDIKYPGGGIHIHAKGFKDVVVWNPHAEAGRAIPDMEEGGWDKYICVEPGMATYWNEIPGKGKWDGQQVLKTL
ncbi:hypothetical protein FRC01_007665 [Tulasnella sp. 417]|nr:hypothetical protein FRC01_007665 [Tulasnella sp. 417]